MLKNKHTQKLSDIICPVNPFLKQIRQVLILLLDKCCNFTTPPAPPFPKVYDHVYSAVCLSLIISELHVEG